MSKSVLTNALIMFGGYSLAGSSNAVNLGYAADELAGTTLADTTHVNEGGLKSVVMGAGGFFDSTPDAGLFTAVGVSDTPVTVAKDTTAGSVAYFFKSLLSEYNPMQANIGELLMFQMNAAARGSLIRGTLMLNATHTSSAASTGQQLGALTSAQELHAALHVFAVSGTSPTLDVDVESDDNAGFTSAAVQDSFAQKTAIGSEYLVIPGAITDDYWRLNFTIGGTSPSFSFAVSLGIK